MKKSYHKWFLTKVIHAINDYQMIAPADKIAVALSGGKDSMVLLYILAELQKYSLFDFDLVAIYIDLGFGIDFDLIQEYCKSMQIPLYIEKTQIAKIVFEQRHETNPCALCAKLRRGALVNTACKLHCNKIALGHQGDDAIETFLMNIIYGARFSSFQPRTDFVDKGISVIRPLIYLQEKTVQAIARNEKLPVVSNQCPVSGKTKRKNMKELLDLIEKEVPEIRGKLLAALQNSAIAELWQKQ